MVPMNTRQKYDCSPDLIRWPHDDIAKAKMYTRIQHDIEPSCVLRTIFWHVKDFGVARDDAAEGLKISRRTYDG